jgi:hypothetical protein
MPEGREAWLLWVCPFLISASPFRRTLWLDCDVIVLRKLSDLFDLLRAGPIVTPSDNKFGRTSNAKELYELAPLLEESVATPEPLINAGVVGFDLLRDCDVLRSCRQLILRAACEEEVRRSISWHDRGALIWAVRNHRLHDRVLEAAWNTAVRSLKDVDPEAVFSHYCADSSLFAALRRDFPAVNILHWNGQERKLWHQLKVNADIA